MAVTHSQKFALFFGSAHDDLLPSSSGRQFSPSIKASRLLPLSLQVPAIMATYFLQQVLTGFAETVNTTSAASPASSVAAPTPLATPAQAALSTPANLAGIITLLFSFSALRDWLKLIVIGGFFETCRRGISWLYAKFIDSMFMNAYFEEDDPSYGASIVLLIIPREILKVGFQNG